MEPKLQFLNYGVEQLIINKNNNTGKVVLSTELHLKDYSISVKLAGYFKFFQAEDLTINQKNEFLNLNGSAILYPYLRMIISNITSTCINKPIIIPTINVAKLFENQKDQN